MPRKRRFYPSEVEILGVPYTIEYSKTPIALEDEQAVVGFIDFENRVLKIYDDGNVEGILIRILHEVLHGIGNLMHVPLLINEETDDDADRIALALAGVLIKNGWLRYQ